MMGDLLDAMVVFPIFGVGVAAYAGLKAMGWKGSVDMQKMANMAKKLKK